MSATSSCSTLHNTPPRSKQFQLLSLVAQFPASERGKPAAGAPWSDLVMTEYLKSILAQLKQGQPTAAIADSLASIQ